LQKTCGQRWGWTADKTLSVTQELYDGACRFSSIETPSGPRCPAAAFAIASARTRSLIRILAEGAWRISKLPLLVWGTIVVAYLVVMERTLPAVFQSTTDQERLVRIGISLAAIMRQLIQSATSAKTPAIERACS
jgi:hypothetical protein